MERIVVPYVYGASDRSADDERVLIEAGLRRVGLDAELRPIDWGRAYGIEPRPSDLDWIVTRRFRQGRTAAERRAMARLEAAVEQAEAGEPIELPAASGGRARLGERTLLRFLWGRTMTIGTLSVMVDVLSYLRRPEGIVGYVTAQLDQIRAESEGRPVVALGLSLGGIILVDALAARGAATAGAADAPAPSIDLLVTVGSQSPFLLACDALGELRRNGPRPLRPFVPWLNVWNPDDYLSYPAGPIFGDAVRPRAALRDVIGRDGAAFPAIHSRYWLDDTTYQAIAAMLADLAAGRFERRP